MRNPVHASFFFFNDTATTEIYTLSLHDALPISATPVLVAGGHQWRAVDVGDSHTCGVDLDGVAYCWGQDAAPARSEEHTSELQSRQYLVCRLLLEKKKTVTSRMRRA